MYSIMNLKRIEQLASLEAKSTMERMVKLQEEVGELAQEVLIAHRTSGSSRKSPGPDGIAGECVDVIIVALSIFFKNGHDENELKELIEKKCEKWEKFQVIN